MVEMIYDALVIGAGAAGIAAARKLHDAGYEVLVLEARDRIGGRVHTDYSYTGFPVELGAEFIHGPKAITHELVQEAGLTTMPYPRHENLWWSSGDTGDRARLYTERPEMSSIRTLEVVYEMLRQAELPQDMSLQDYFTREMGFWNFSPLIETANVLFAQTCCAPIHRLSAQDLQREMQVDHAGSGDFKIVEGYSALFDWYSRGLNIGLNMPVTAVQQNDRGVKVIAGGETFRALTCIITLPVSVLQPDIIEFDPPLSDAKQIAIQSLKMEAATKVIFKLREACWPEDFTFMAYPDTMARWWTPSYGRDGDPTITCYITDSRARTVDKIFTALESRRATSDSPEKFIPYGVRELGKLLGCPPDNIVDVRRMSWADEPYTGGGYAYVPVGKAAARVTLAQPEGRLYFAGEATAYDTNPQTVHGAIESGWRAVDECMRHLV